MTPYEIPLTANAQTFSIPLGGLTYNLNVYWNPVSMCWCIDLADSLNNPVISGMVLVTGLDLLDQYAYLNLGGSLVVQSDYSADAVPQYADLGATGHLYFVVTP